jgi:Cys-tRNA(Pro)/Cys-tRNA(Cys) deacylase
MSEKTNAARLLDLAGIQYKLSSYDITDGAIDGKSAARKLGISEDEIFKTLVAVGASGSIFVFVIPVSSELNLKKAAKASGEKSIEMLPLKDLFKTTGYVKGGCSPIGMKKHFPTYFDETLILLDTVVFNAGKVGLQLHIPVQKLNMVLHYNTADLAEE